jgi:hypothetical protein
MQVLRARSKAQQALSATFDIELVHLRPQS